MTGTLSHHTCLMDKNIIHVRTAENNAVMELRPWSDMRQIIYYCLGMLSINQSI